jgi:hypothetical protein
MFVGRSICDVKQHEVDANILLMLTFGFLGFCPKEIPLNPP